MTDNAKSVGHRAIPVNPFTKIVNEPTDFVNRLASDDTQRTETVTRLGFPALRHGIFATAQSVFQSKSRNPRAKSL
jgi:hypothetical protein